MMAIDWTQVTRRRPLRVILKMWHTDAPWAPSPDSRKPYILRCWLEVGNNGNMHVSRIEHEPLPFVTEHTFIHLARPLRTYLCQITGREIKPFQAGVFEDIGPVGEWPMRLPAGFDGLVVEYFEGPVYDRGRGIHGMG